MVPERNSLGLSSWAAARLDEAFDAVARGEADIVVVLENDLYRRAPAAEVDDLSAPARRTSIALDHTRERDHRGGRVVLPAAHLRRGTGTFVNNEGRAQRYFQVFPPRRRRAPGAGAGCATSLVRARARATARGWTRRPTTSLAALEARAARVRRRRSPPRRRPTFRIDGQKIARQPPRYSGRTAMHADLTVFEPKPPDDPDIAAGLLHGGLPAGAAAGR